MVLIDTSIWIEFLKSNPDYADEVELLLESKQVVTIEPVFAELLYGSRSEKERNIIFSYWKVMPRIKFVEGSFIESADYANNNPYHILGIGLIGAVLSDKTILNNLDKQFLYKT